MRFNDFYYLTEKSYWKDDYVGRTFYVQKILASPEDTKKILTDLLEKNKKLIRIEPTEDVDFIVRGGAKSVMDAYFKGEDGSIYKFEGISKNVLIDEESLEKFDAAKYENLIVLWHNKINTPDMTEEQLRDLSGLSDSKYDKLYEKFVMDEQFVELGKKYANATSKEIKGLISQTGRASVELTDFWLENGGVDTTPKTDVAGGDYKISIKKSGGSQLLSATYGESNATFAAALKNIGNKTDPELKEKLEKIRDKTIWTDVNTGEYPIDVTSVKKLIPDEISKEMRKRKDKRDNDKIVRGLNEFISEQSKHPVISQIISGMILNSQLDQILQEILQKDKELKYEFTKEAMTGNIKFGTESIGSANYILVFDTEGNLKTKKIDRTIIEKYASKVKYNVTYKSSGSKVATALRGAMRENNINMDMIIEGVFDDLLDIGKSMLKTVVEKAKDWFDIIKNFLIEFYRKAMDFIIRISERGYNALLSILGMELYEVVDNNPTLYLDDF